LKLSNQLAKFLDGQFILVIEPSINYRALIKNIFSHLKLKNVRYVRSVAEARREMTVVKVGMFIVEWQMTEKNGLEFCREVRKDARFEQTPFLLLSSENMHNDIILASEGGINCYLLKPFSFPDFTAQLTSLIQRKNSPSVIDSLLDRADFHLKGKEFWVAETLFNEVLSLKPASAKALCGLGRVQMERSNIPEALSFFRRAVAANPNYVESYKFMLQHSESRGDHLGILHAATILHDLSPENPRYPLLIACAQLELKNPTESEKYFKLCIRLSPLVATGHKGLGNLYFVQKEYKKSQKSLERALDLDATDVGTLNSLGTALVRLGKFDEGIHKYRIALSLSPADARVLFNLGLALEVSGELTEAITSFERALTADPKNVKAQRNISRIEKLVAANEKTSNSGDEKLIKKLPRSA
jgi:tetratricopeptide (TPR) repeat protein